jgi:hypothetical protein
MCIVHHSLVRKELPMTFASTALIVYLSLPGAPLQRPVRQTATICRALPENIQISGELRSAVGTLLAKSATFRRQCALIAAAPSVRVGMMVVTSSLGPNTRARAIARRYSTGVVIVSVQIPAASDYIELIAHELEHVTELVDGVDLRALAIDQPTAVRQRRDDGAFETARARAAGEAAAVEVYGHIDPTLVIVGRTVLRAGRSVWRALPWPRSVRALLAPPLAGPSRRPSQMSRAR